MKRNGFSLVELVVIIAVIGILAAVASANFKSYDKKQRMESQIKAIHADLMALRAESLFCKQSRAAKITPAQFSIYSSNETDCSPLISKRLDYPVTNTNLTLTFDERGLVKPNISICIEEAHNPASTDSLVVYRTRIQMGKRKPGAECNSDHIVTR